MSCINLISGGKRCRAMSGKCKLYSQNQVCGVNYTFAFTSGLLSSETCPLKL